MNPQDLEQIALIYDQLRSLYRKIDPSIDKKLAAQFDNYLKTVMLNLSNSLKNPDLSVIEQNSEVLKSKFFLYDVCFEKATKLLQKNGLAEEASVFDQIRQGTCSSFVYLSQQIGFALEHSDALASSKA